MIDVKALAQQADIDYVFIAGYSRELVNTATNDELETFAALILEAAAVKCDDIWQEDGTALQCRDAIRGMKPKGDV